MLQYLLTVIAGVALGVVGLRIWQMREAGGTPLAGSPAEQTSGESSPVAAGSSATAPISTRNLLIGAGALVAVAIAAFTFRSSDAGKSADAGTAGALGAGPGQPVDDVNTMITRLADRLAKNPNDGDGFRMLGWSYLMTGHPDKAIEPYKRAMVLLPGKPIVEAGYGEALVGVAAGKVTDEAKALFDRAIKSDPSEPRARFFEAMWQAQHGDERGALDKWIALANDSPADASWQPDLRKQIDTTAAKLGVNVSGKLKNAVAAAPAGVAGSAPQIPPAAMQAAGALPDSDRQAMINQMVQGLADKLKANPKDTDGWVRLLRSRMVLQQGDQARSDLNIARKALAGDAAALAKVNAAATEFSVPGA